MAWIKRNLFFLIGSLIAVALMVVGVFYLLGQYNDLNQVNDDIQKQYTELGRLAHLPINPGNESINNILAAKDQDAVFRGFVKKERGLFQPIDPIPNGGANRISNADFARELRNTIAELRRSASAQNVELPADYYFSFEAQKKSVIFDTGSLEPLAMHLGEIKALCDALFMAKIQLDGIQREIVSSNQDNNASDYISRKTVSTPLADLTPYQVVFRGFSADLAQVLTALATSPHGFVVQSINVEPAETMEAMAGGPFTGQQQPGTAFPPPSPPGQNFRDQFRRPPGAAFPPPGATAPAPVPSGPVDFLREKKLRVTMLVQVVKPKLETKVK